MISILHVQMVIDYFLRHNRSINPVALSLLKKTQKSMRIFYNLLTMRWRRSSNTFLVTDKDRFLLLVQYHDCSCPDDGKGPKHQHPWYSFIFPWEYPSIMSVKKFNKYSFACGCCCACGCCLCYQFDKMFSREVSTVTDIFISLNFI